MYKYICTRTCPSTVQLKVSALKAFESELSKRLGSSPATPTAGVLLPTPTAARRCKMPEKLNRKLIKESIVCHTSIIASSPTVLLVSYEYLCFRITQRPSVDQLELYKRVHSISTHTRRVVVVIVLRTCTVVIQVHVQY